MTSQYNSPGHSSANPPLSNRWQDWANAILGAWLFVSPWVLGFGRGAVNAVTGGNAGNAANAVGNAAHNAAGAVGNVAGGHAVGGAPTGNAAWDAWILGAIIFLVSLSALARMAFWQERVNTVLGIWVFIAPFVLGFTGLANAAWNHWIVGALVFLVGVSSIAMAQRRPKYSEAYAGDKPTYTTDKTRPPL
jgi:hypothetical protein